VKNKQIFKVENGPFGVKCNNSALMRRSNDNSQRNKIKIPQATKVCVSRASEKQARGGVRKVGHIKIKSMMNNITNVKYIHEGLCASVGKKFIC
jgi:hypothetical protein